MNARTAVLLSTLLAVALLAAAAPAIASMIHKAMPYPYIYVLADGSARELHENERKYLETEFSGGDGNMPYVKDSYAERNGWGELKGFLKRAQLPRGTVIHAAPAEDPSKPMNREELIAFLRGKGLDLIENADGSFSTRKPR